MFNDNLLNKCKFIQLEDLDKVQLLNRKDTKFVFHLNQLQNILEKLLPVYQILKIEENLIFQYNNRYFDTVEFLFYQQHHNEKRNRYKIRFRNYSSINKTYFEIKTKNNKDRTVKNRILVEENHNGFNLSETELIQKIIGINPEQLAPSLNVKFNRITLVDLEFNERLTIDTNLTVQNGTDHKIFENLVISEIKQNKYNPKSPFIKILRNKKIPEMKFSKYCMGLIHVNKGLKQNRFKPKLNAINKILKLDTKIGN